MGEESRDLKITAGKESQNLNEFLKNLELKLSNVTVTNELTENMRQFRENLTSSTKAAVSFSKAFQAIGDMQKRFSALSNQLVAEGIIKNQESVATLLRTSLTVPSFPIMTQLKMADSVISFQKALAKNRELLKQISLPHMPLYRDILESVDEHSISEVQEELESYSSHAEGNEEVKLVRPYFFDAAIKVNIYMTVTENYIESNENVTEEEKTIWHKILKPFLGIVFTIFMGWAMGNTPVKDMQIVKQFDKVVEIIQEYHQPAETTDIQIQLKNEEEL
ncbi:hypothetical protein [Neobacillus mesonae]|uniref:hypothetical protein n=1 Tax=Neobacillus mesonae TaxID=1193713 RepID=UPI0020414E9D|nr:hypothetical protein [Neobacillus mesonae]MCM3569840.1 hypothetical protein [Neobacillus mesonae]